MITLYRPAYYRVRRAHDFAGLSTDVKPIPTQNGAKFYEIDTGTTYVYDQQNKMWIGSKVQSWDCPRQSGDTLLIVQAYNVVQSGDTLLIT